MLSIAVFILAYIVNEKVKLTMFSSKIYAYLETKYFFLTDLFQCNFFCCTWKKIFNAVEFSQLFFLMYPHKRGKLSIERSQFILTELYTCLLCLGCNYDFRIWNKISQLVSQFRNWRNWATLSWISFTDLNSLSWGRPPRAWSGNWWSWSSWWASTFYWITWYR